jgi:putative flippase GtrA
MIKLSDSAVFRYIFKDRVKITFLLVGIWNTIFGYSIYLILLLLFKRLFNSYHYSYLPAMIFGNVLSIINAYIFHKYFTFKSRAIGFKLIYEFIRFFMTYVFIMVVSTLLLPIFIEIFNINAKMAGALSIIITTAISYFGHSRFSFNYIPNNPTAEK